MPETTMDAPSRGTTTSGGDLLCEALVAQGIDTVFGHPGGAILPVYDALFRQEAIRHVLVRHEQAAAHAADGYARATGRTGVCVATSGPGATNLVTGLATAMMDSVPLVAVTGQVATGALGTEAFQEADTIGITIPITKHGFLVTRTEDIPDVIAEAFRIATSGRPGPVVVDLPKNVQASVVGPALLRPPARVPDRLHAPIAEEDVLRAAHLLNSHERVLVMVGRGVVLSRASEMVREVVERADLPVVTTLLGLDAFPAENPRALGMPGMHGTERANRAIQAADVILGLGLRFDDRVTGRIESFAPRSTIIHMNIDPVSVDRTPRPTLNLIGDLSETLPRLIPHIENRSRPRWTRELCKWDRMSPVRPLASEPPHRLTARRAIREVAGRVSRSRAIVVTDVGQHQMWLAQELPDAEPGTHLTSGGLGTMGFALPAALGAALARTGRPVWAVAGDGGFQMNIQELGTVAQERLPLKIVVINNGFLGMVRQWQELFYERRYSGSEISSPDFAAVARAYGIPSVRASNLRDATQALDRAERAGGPTLVELKVANEENVYPIVPAGASLDELVVEPGMERELS